MTNEEKEKRITMFLLAIQVLQKRIQTLFYQMAALSESALILSNRSSEFIACNIELLEKDFVKASKIVAEDK